MLGNFQTPDRPALKPEYTGPRIATIYGFASRAHMKRNLLSFIRNQGFPDTTMYGHLQSELIAQDLAAAAKQNRRIVLIGFSQGGFEAMTTARLLQQRDITVDMMVLIAARGRGGRAWPHRWRFDMRNVPANVKLCLNYFAEGDFLGTDPKLDENQAFSSNDASRVVNIVFSRQEKVSHLAISKCYPDHKVHPRVKTKLLDRLISALSELS